MVPLAALHVEPLTREAVAVAAPTPAEPARREPAPLGAPTGAAARAVPSGGTSTEPQAAPPAADGPSEGGGASAQSAGRREVTRLKRELDSVREQARPEEFAEISQDPPEDRRGVYATVAGPARAHVRRWRYRCCITSRTARHCPPRSTADARRHRPPRASDVWGHPHSY